MVFSVCSYPINYFFNRAEEDDLSQGELTPSQLRDIQEAQRTFSAESRRQIAILMAIDIVGLSTADRAALEARFIEIYRAEGYQGDMLEAAHGIFNR